MRLVAGASLVAAERLVGACGAAPASARRADVRPDRRAEVAVNWCERAARRPTRADGDRRRDGGRVRVQRARARARTSSTRRPSQHHAKFDRADGYCYVNDCVLAILKVCAVCVLCVCCVCACVLSRNNVRFSCARDSHAFCTSTWTFTTVRDCRLWRGFSSGCQATAWRKRLSTLTGRRAAFGCCFVFRQRARRMHAAC